MSTPRAAGAHRPVPRRPSTLAFALVPLLALLAACGRDFNEFPDLDRAATAVEYEVRLNGAPNEEARDLMEESLLVYRRQEIGAQSMALLRRRAQDDVETVQKILRSFGYYEGEVDVDVDPVAALEPEPFSAKETISGAAGAVTEKVSGITRAVVGVFRTPAEEREPQPDADDLTDQPPAGFARVTIDVDPGRPFTLTRHDLVLIDGGPGGAPTIPSAEQLGSPVRQAAVAEEILVAENKAVQLLRQSGRPYATRQERDSVADLELDTIEVDTLIGTGREYVFGETRISGAPSVETDYLLSYKPYVAGERVDIRELELYQERLIETGLFDAGSVRLPEEPPVGDQAPVLVELEERPPRTIAGGVEYATDTGPAANASFEHRNLSRENEQLRIDLFAGLEEQWLETRFRKPQWRRPGQDLTAGFRAEHRDDEAYTGYTAVATVGVEREINDYLDGGLSALLETSYIEDEGDEEIFYLAGLPGFLAYDDTDDLLDPTQGLRLRLDLAPFAGVSEDGFPAFVITELNGSTYFDLTDDEEYILALRGRLGSIVAAAGLEEVPPQRRFYSGGGGSVRGYADRLIGPLDRDDDPVGGLSVVETAVELRAPLWRDIGLGGVVFLDAGAVSSESLPTFGDGLQVAAGTGLRYASPVGPLRFDVAFPLNPRDVDDLFQFYISIGQAF